MIFEKIGAVQVDKDLQALKIQKNTELYLIGLQDLEQAIKNNRVIGVFQIKETPIKQETAVSEKVVAQIDPRTKNNVKRTFTVSRG